MIVQYGMAPVPNSSTLIPGFTTTTALYKLVAANTSTSATVSITVSDSTTVIVPAIDIPAKTIQVVLLGEVPANGGAYWFASQASTLNAWIRGIQ